ncbi:spore cortex-lytic enzyme [Gracilibacillus boraciitolerans JCM 21714]|uniref:Spore cortex-lytic enzyme n=1 Tax=Gracilibacillus boraciitolerans JCM 21714 TaxID=1298598 RepID=W4VF05_9BACI|nr:spore cortex-lytic enzyme [Gracilibacillus boraciitolerans]GAE91344.1 spore cortex-lytic enzyme [Gracilibacillus boraciitolerans JCM 21714]
MLKKITVCTLFFIIFSIFIVNIEDDNKVKGFSNQIIQQGATGDDVIELQARLQYLGYYNGKIDGVFGWGTYWALRNFQYEFGLEIDGMAGQTTKQKLEKASEFDKKFVHQQIQQGKKFSHYGGVDKQKQTDSNQSNLNQGSTGNKPQQEQQPNKTAEADLQPTAVNIPQGFSQNDIQIMANAVYGEARGGEPFEGQVAVAAVILNRVESPTFPNTVSGVIFEPRAFTAVADGQIYLTPNDSAKRAVLDAINGWDPTGEAVYYFNPNTATSGWIWSRPQIKRIGKHIFCM